MSPGPWLVLTYGVSRRKRTHSQRIRLPYRQTVVKDIACPKQDSRATSRHPTAGPAWQISGRRGSWVSQDRSSHVSRNVGTGLRQGATSHSTTVVWRRHVVPRASTVGARGARVPLVAANHHSSLLGYSHFTTGFPVTSLSPVTVVKMLARQNRSFNNRGPAMYDCTRRHVGARESCDSKPGSTRHWTVRYLRSEGRATLILLREDIMHVLTQKLTRNIWLSTSYNSATGLYVYISRFVCFVDPEW